MAPLRKLGPPLLDTIAPTSYIELNTLFDAAVPYGGVLRYWKSSFLKNLGDDLLEIMIDRATPDALADVDGVVLPSSRCGRPGQSAGDGIRGARGFVGLPT